MSLINTCAENTCKAETDISSVQTHAGLQVG